jgi:uncharacterized repeat protein (TIGR03803 family)
MHRIRTRMFPLIVIVAILATAFSGVADAQTLSVLYNFGSNTGDPIQPQPAVIAQGRDGNLFSTTERGGANTYYGTVFEITPRGNLSVLYSFGPSVGEYPTGGLTLGTDGNLYGATQSGGDPGFGIIFKITSSGELTVLHNFAKSDGASPYGPPIQGTDGAFYGTTLQGGNGNYGTVYRMTASGQLTTLYEFDNSDGAGPIAPLVQGADGAFYGVTVGGGSYGDGTVFRITSQGKLTTLYMFDGTDGSNPSTPLVQGTDGDFYGTTTMGGAYTEGTVFKVTGTGEITVLYSFSAASGNGYDPEGGLALGTDGRLYGTAYQGGNNNAGTIYRITSQSKYAVVHKFDGTQGSGPLVTLLQHTTGLIYGDTYAGGTYNDGVFYSLNAGLKPFVSLLPYSGKVGKTIEFLGQRFKGTTGVSFNGKAAKFKVVSDTYLTAIVPKGSTTGYVTVTTRSGKLKSNKKFRVL